MSKIIDVLKMIGGFIGLTIASVILCLAIGIGARLVVIGYGLF